MLIQMRRRGKDMALFPFFIDITNKHALLIGGGKHALEKIEKLRPFGVKLHVIATEVCLEIEKDETIFWHKRNFKDEDITKDLAFVIAASDDAELNHYISALCQEKNILVNVVDDQPYCQFIFPSLVTRGNLSVGICTAGASPAVGVRIRKQVEELLPNQTEQILDWLASKRPYITEHITNGKKRFAFYHKLAGICMDENRILSEEEFLELIKIEEDR